MPKVSVIVPTYRRHKTLQRALESIARQSYVDYEIVVVDDNAVLKWNSMVKKIIDDFMSKYPEIKLIYIVNDKNLGSAQTRNIGIDCASGEYITFLDDDDIYLPMKIEKQVVFMEKNGFDYSITDLYLYNNKGKVIDKRIRSYICDITIKKLFEYHMKYHITGTDTMMFRKDYIIAIGAFPLINVGDEFYLMQRSIEGGGKFGYLPGCDIKAYIHVNTMGLSSGQGKIDGENSLYEHKKKYFDRLSKNTVKYIKVRHYTVLSYTYLRMRHVWLCLANSIRGFLISPALFFKILINR